VSAENGNGEVKQLLEIKRNYRRNLVSLEMDLKAKFERELAEGKKQLQSTYLESIVDVVFAEAPQSPPAEETVAAPPAPVQSESQWSGAKVLARECPECASSVREDDKFCPNCAYPLKDPLKEDEKPVSIATRRKLGTRVRH
jgi:hypothetical protein